MAIESMPIMEAEDMDIEEAVELAIDIPDIVLDGDIDIDMVPVELPIDISMTGRVIE